MSHAPDPAHAHAIAGTLGVITLLCGAIAASDASMAGTSPGPAVLVAVLGLAFVLGQVSEAVDPRDDAHAPRAARSE